MGFRISAHHLSSTVASAHPCLGLLTGKAVATDEAIIGSHVFRHTCKRVEH